MADISVTQSAVVAANANTVKATGVSGAAITAGQAVYADPADSYKIKPAQANSANPTHAPNAVGIALNNAPGANQPVTYATDGDVIFNNVLTTGQVYALSAANAGGIAPYADLASTNFVTVLGVATGGTNLRLSLIPTSAQK
jgi:hypothetical protein